MHEVDDLSEVCTKMLKKDLHHLDFLSGHPPRYYPGAHELEFSVRKGTANLSWL